MDISAPVYSLNRLATILRYPRRLLEELAEEPGKFYRPFPDPKSKPGKAPRMIDNPIPPLKNVQKAIYKKLLKPIPFPDCVQGSVPGGSTTRNAQRHVGRRVVVGLDVVGCFPSITNCMVFRTWRTRLGHSPDVARLLTKLTTFCGHLPHGASTSSALANLVMLPALYETVEKAKPRGVEVGQYVDDQALSGGMIGLPLITDACQAFSRVGLRISRSKEKFRIMRSGRQQVVTGLGVNKRLGIPKDARAKIRAAVHQLETRSEKPRPSDKEYQSARARVARLARYHPGEAKLLQVRLDALVP